MDSNPRVTLRVSGASRFEPFLTRTAVIAAAAAAVDVAAAANCDFR